MGILQEIIHRAIEDYLYGVGCADIKSKYLTITPGGYYFLEFAKGEADYTMLIFFNFDFDSDDKKFNYNCAGLLNVMFTSDGKVVLDQNGIEEGCKGVLTSSSIDDVLYPALNNDEVAIETYMNWVMNTPDDIDW